MFKSLKLAKFRLGNPLYMFYVSEHDEGSNPRFFFTILPKINDAYKELMRIYYPTKTVGVKMTTLHGWEDFHVIVRQHRDRFDQPETSTVYLKELYVPNCYGIVEVSKVAPLDVLLAMHLGHRKVLTISLRSDDSLL